MKKLDSFLLQIYGILFVALLVVVWVVSVGISAGKAYGALDYDADQRAIARQAKEEALKEEALISRGELKAYRAMAVIPSKEAK